MPAILINPAFAAKHRTAFQTFAALRFADAGAAICTLDNGLPVYATDVIALGAKWTAANLRRLKIDRKIYAASIAMVLVEDH